MTRRLSGLLPMAREEFVFPESMGEPRLLLATLFQSSTVGVAVCDRQLRFRAINDALASMNGVPASAHLGRSIHSILGRAAVQIESAFEHVFATGKPVCNFEVTAKLPDRACTGHWNEHYFPIKNRRNKVQYVGAIVLELSGRDEMASAVSGVLSNLAVVSTALRSFRGALSSVSELSQEEVFSRSIGLLERCLGDVRALAALLASAPSFQTLRPGKVCGLSEGALESSSGDSAGASTIAGVPDFISPLSSREQEVVAQLAAGATNREVARTLGISVRTVESHRAKIMLKLNLESVSDLVRYALRNRIVQP